MNNTKRIVSLVLSAVLVLGLAFAMSSCKRHEHEYEGQWSTDATNHWHKATCEHTDEKSDLGAHVDGNNDGACDVCNYTMRASGGNTPTGPQIVTYTVIVKNKKGEVVPGVEVKLVGKANENDNNGDHLSPKFTDEEGKVTFEPSNKLIWSAQIVSTPEGYDSARDYDEETKQSYKVMYAFGDATSIEIVLEDVVAEPAE